MISSSSSPALLDDSPSLDLDVGAKKLELITTNLPGRAPLLEVLSIRCSGHRDPVLPPALFSGDLSSLHKLRLMRIPTELPWRNMVNLTSFMFRSEDPPSIEQLLGFFEGAPHLREVDLISRTPVFGTQTGRLVPLACLKRMGAINNASCNLFDHLLIPVGAHLEMGVDPRSHQIEGCPPKFIDNLKNLANFIAITLSAVLTFSGPNGEVTIVPQATGDLFLLGLLAHFDTSKAERLTIAWGTSPTSDHIYRAFLLMKNLRTLTLYHCHEPLIIIRVLDPSINSSGVLVCPRLEELSIVHFFALVDMEIEVTAATAAARASRGARLKTLRVDTFVYPQPDVLKLEKYISHVEFGNDVSLR